MVMKQLSISDLSGMTFRLPERNLCVFSKNSQLWMLFLWSDAVIASVGNHQEAKPEIHFQTWSISEVANLQNIAAVKAISAPTENEKEALTMPDCKYCQDKICPVVDVPGVCRFEEREEAQ